MDFELSGEQQMLRDNVARLMKDKYGFEQRKAYGAAAQGFSEELWRQYGIGKGKAFRLWQTGECAGQTLGRGMLVLSRADVEQWQQKREPGLGPA